MLQWRQACTCGRREEFMSEQDATEFATLLRRFRHQRRLTQEELAEHSGVSLGAISLLERGLTQGPQRGTVEMLATALELDAEEAVAFVAATRHGRWTDTVAQERESAASQTPAGDARLTSLPDKTLPIPWTPLYGREHDEEVLLGLLQDPTPRLVTLIGPAGVGKTRLALLVATQLRDVLRQKVIYVDLIPIHEVARTLPAIAEALGVQESGDKPLRDVVIQALGRQPLVLVLDNFEQILSAARVVLELLVACPNVKALVTSRSPLNVRGEQCYSVAPLALPSSEQRESLEDLYCVPAVALFLSRASPAQPPFINTTLEEGRLVADICARLDGLPLAIELASARVKQTGLRQLRDWLAQPAFLGALTNGPQDLADHQRAMRSTIAWSYDLLSGEEQRVFRGLGVFVGGVSADAVAFVLGMTHDEALVGLATLVNANLLRNMDTGDIWRYTQLVTLQVYAQEQARAAGEWDEARRRHGEYFVALTQRIDLRMADQAEGVYALLETEYENIHAALAWAWETGATAQGLRMVGNLRRYWDARAQFREGLIWSERFVAVVGETANEQERSTLAQAWTSVVVMAYRLDRLERAREAGEAALEIQRQRGDKRDIAAAAMGLANVLTSLRDYEGALALYDECLALQREVNNRQGMIFPLFNLGNLYLETGRPREALTNYEESLALSHAVGESDFARGLTWNGVGEALIFLDEPRRAIEVTQPNYQLFVRERSAWFAATCAFTLGRAYWRLGDVEVAGVYLDEAGRAFETLGSSLVSARVRYVRATLALERGDDMSAQRGLTQAFADLQGVSELSKHTWRLIERAGSLVCRRGQLERAARLYGAALAHCDEAAPPYEPAELQLRARDLDSLRERFGEKTLEILMVEAKALSSEAAVSLAQQELA